MKYRIKRIQLKSGELVTKRELLPVENLFEGTLPIVGDVLIVRCKGRKFNAKVVWGNWPGREHPTDSVVPLRVQET